jgi:hypothetical protein
VVGPGTGTVRSSQPYNDSHSRRTVFQVLTPRNQLVTLFLIAKLKNLKKKN